MISNKILWKQNILAVDKFKNISSTKLVEKVKGILENVCSDPLLKVGHGGTLDETATGVLVMGTGIGCKMLPYFLHGSKEYQVKAKLGIETDTYNETGTVIYEKSFQHVTENMIVNESKRFVGKIFQVPPKFSALKVNGKRIADLTRQGVDVKMESRRVVCYSIKFVSFDPPMFDLVVTCGGGFYVRSLIHDLGLALGTCAHVVELHRTRHGFLTEKDAVRGQDLHYSNLVKNAQEIEAKPEFRRLLRKFSSKPSPRNNLWFDPS